jgi:hypothetical protein
MFGRRLFEDYFQCSILLFLGIYLLRVFDVVNKNRLKNILRKYLVDDCLLTEIEKMFYSGIIDISNDFIYNSKEFLGYSLLSSFLLNLYMKEFDIFIISSISQYNFKKNFYRNIKNVDKHFITYHSMLKRFFPIRSDIELTSIRNLKKFVFMKYKFDI